MFVCLDNRSDFLCAFLRNKGRNLKAGIDSLQRTKDLALNGGVIASEGKRDRTMKVSCHITIRAELYRGLITSLFKANNCKANRAVVVGA